MPLTFILRRLLLIALLVLPQIYWLKIVLRLSKRSNRLLRYLIRLLVIFCWVAMIAVLIDRISAKFLPPRISYRIAPPVQLWIFSSTFAFFFTKALHMVVWLWERLLELIQKPTKEYIASRRAMLRQTASIVGTAPFAAAIYGYGRERLHFEVEHVEVPLANLPRALNGMRILQLSDIHVGDFMPLHEIRRAVLIANELDPHVAVITGDFVTSWGDPLAECIGELGRLRSPLGTWACNGNHEIYAGAEDDAEKIFAANGMTLLRHSASQLKWNGADFNLIGIDYQRNIPMAGKPLPTLNGAESLVRREMPNILLSHNPNTFPSAAAAGVELSLSGHTHGGQVDVEILHTALNPARFITSFIAGLYHLPIEKQRTQQAFLYVNRGLGTLGFPARIGSRPEITLLTLRSSQAG
ncbi:MAG TPA: metallophosphoesterase [Terracidiphilus sp.]|nr:metallophosphoesterase [Terracidiphilus sp.]